MSRLKMILVCIALLGIHGQVVAVAAPDSHDPLAPWVREVHTVWEEQLMRLSPGSPGQGCYAPWPARSPLFHVDDALFAQGWLRLQIDTGPGGEDAQTLRAACEAAIPALRWEGAGGHRAQVCLPIGDLPRLAEIPGLYSAMRPPTGLPLAKISEGVAECGAPRLHSQGVDGTDIKVGVLDVGFIGARGLLGSELPADTQMRAFVGSTSGGGDLSNGTAHGTACAEIVHDVAPGAQLYLANAATPTELEAAIRWMRDEGVSIVSHSVGWFWGPGDGTGDIVDLVHTAINNDMLWVNAVGNQATAFWGGAFLDDNGDDTHEFDAAGDTTITDQHVEVRTEYVWVLTWDRWPYSHDLGFEMDLYEQGELVATSEQATTPEGYAYRELFYTTSSVRSTVELVIRRKTGIEGANLRLFQLGGRPLPEHGTTAGSFVIPADAEEVLSVGAYSLSGVTPVLESFSSRGPTPQGVSKPEICALDQVTTHTTAPFGGTSAACPHVAGAVALLYDAAPEGGFFDFRWSPEAVAAILERSAAEAGFDDPEACDWGILRMPEAAEEGKRAVGGGRLAVSSPARGEVALRLEDGSATGGQLEVFDAGGRLVHRSILSATQLRGETFTWRALDARGQRLPLGLYLLRARGEDWEAKGRTYLIQ